MSTDDRAITRVAQFIHDRAGLCFGGHKQRLLKQRLKERLLQLGLSDLRAYTDVLSASQTEQKLLLELVTTNETSFFRNPRQFDYLMRRIVPELEERQGKTVLRTWSEDSHAPIDGRYKLHILCAGCSTGEEPYSVAMALLSSLRYPRAWKIEILAGDLISRCISIAQEGRYENDKLRGLVNEFRSRYTDDIPGGIVVKPEVRQLIRFSTMNLNDILYGKCFPGLPGGFAGFDIIFCRNVLIYFSLSSQQLLIDLLHNSLRPGGYLFTGDAEPLHLYNHSFLTVRDARSLIYQKTETDADVKSFR